MTFTIFAGLASVYLLTMAFITTAADNWPSKIVFKLIPLLLGMPLAFLSFAKFMGWPM